MKKSKLFYKLTLRLSMVVLLIIAMTVVTYAYAMNVLRVDNNTFTTGLIDIDLNGGMSIVTDIDKIEPGATFVRDFYLRNNSTDVGGVYYKLYFEDITGMLATILDIEIRDRDSGELLVSGKMSEITAENVEAFDNVLELGETKWFTISFHYPEEEGNRGMGTELSFTLSADAVQTKNNPDKLFD